MPSHPHKAHQQEEIRNQMDTRWSIAFYRAATHSFEVDPRRLPRTHTKTTLLSLLLRNDNAPIDRCSYTSYSVPGIDASTIKTILKHQLPFICPSRFSCPAFLCSSNDSALGPFAQGSPYNILIVPLPKVPTAYVPRIISNLRYHTSTIHNDRQQ